MGADVVKIERPEGDVNRNIGPARHPGMGANFMNINRNKRSVVLDLKKSIAMEALMKFVATADVFVHSMRRSAAEKLGLGYQALAARNPRLVYAAATGYWHDGTRGGRPAYDDVIQGESGAAALNRIGGGEPRYFPMTFSDKFVGAIQASAIGMALFNRERTGLGQEVYVPMFETMLAFNFTEHLWGATFDPPLTAPGYPRMLTPHRKPYRAADGYICVHAVTDSHWRRLFEVIGRPEIISDERFSSVNQRSRNMEALYEILAGELRNYRVAEVSTRLDKAGVPNAPLNELKDLLTDKYLAEIDFFKRVDHPSEGRVVNTAIPVQFSRTPTSVRRLAPRLGEHTKQILEELGYGEAEIAEMSGGAVREAGSGAQ